MNTESKFGLKDSVATAVILAAMLVFILVGIVTQVGVRAERATTAAESANRSCCR